MEENKSKITTVCCCDLRFIFPLCKCMQANSFTVPKSNVLQITIGDCEAVCVHSFIHWQIYPCVLSTKGNHPLVSTDILKLYSYVDTQSPKTLVHQCSPADNSTYSQPVFMYFTTIVFPLKIQYITNEDRV